MSNHSSSFSPTSQQTNAPFRVQDNSPVTPAPQGEISSPRIRPTNNQKRKQPPIKSPSKQNATTSIPSTLIGTEESDAADQNSRKKRQPIVFPNAVGKKLDSKETASARAASNQADEERKAKILSFGSDVTSKLPFKGRPLSSASVKNRLRKQINSGQKRRHSSMSSAASKYSSGTTTSKMLSPNSKRRNNHKHRFSGASTSSLKQSPSSIPGRRSQKRTPSVPTKQMIRLNEERSQTSLFGKMSPRVKPRKIHSAASAIRPAYASNSMGPLNMDQDLEVSGASPVPAEEGHHPAGPLGRIPPRQIQTADRITRRRRKVSGEGVSSSLGGTSLQYTTRAQDPLMHDQTVKQGEKYLQDAYSFKPFQSTKSNFAQHIDLPSLGIKLLIDKREKKYNFYKRPSNASSSGRTPGKKSSRKARHQRTTSRGAVDKLLEQDNDMLGAVPYVAPLLPADDEEEDATNSRATSAQTSTAPWIRNVQENHGGGQVNAFTRNAVLQTGEAYLMHLYGVST